MVAVFCLVSCCLIDYASTLGIYELEDQRTSELLSEYVDQRRTAPRQTLKHIGNNNNQSVSLAQVSVSYEPRMVNEHRTIFSNIKVSSVRLAEWIEDSNVLLALIIGIIVVFLVVCILCFYFAFFPDGIP
mgnify:CR=1 FL=1